LTAPAACKDRPCPRSRSRALRDLEQALLRAREFRRVSGHQPQTALQLLIGIHRPHHIARDLDRAQHGGGTQRGAHQTAQLGRENPRVLRPACCPALPVCSSLPARSCICATARVMSARTRIRNSLSATFQSPPSVRVRTAHPTELRNIKIKNPGGNRTGRQHIQSLLPGKSPRSPFAKGEVFVTPFCKDCRVRRAHRAIRADAAERWDRVRTAH